MNNPNPLYGALGGDFVGSIYDLDSRERLTMNLIVAA